MTSLLQVIVTNIRSESVLTMEDARIAMRSDVRFAVSILTRMMVSVLVCGKKKRNTYLHWGHTMKVIVKVRQFEFNNQGQLNEVETVTRELHVSSYYGPEQFGNGCCAPIVQKQTYQWVMYKGTKYQVRERLATNPDNCNYFEINLPGR